MKTVLVRTAVVVLGVLSLPVTALLLDGTAVGDWVVTIQLVAAGVIGGVLGLVLPGVATGSRVRRFVHGAALGLAGAVAGNLLLLALLVGVLS